MYIGNSYKFFFFIPTHDKPLLFIKRTNTTKERYTILIIKFYQFAHRKRGMFSEGCWKGANLRIVSHNFFLGIE